MSGFRITDGKGFGMSFANGWRISVQFGYGNYCDNKGGANFQHEDYRGRNQKLGAQGCDNAEVAVFNPAGDMVKLPAFLFDDAEYADTVSGWETPNEVLQLMNWVAGQKA